MIIIGSSIRYGQPIERGERFMQITDWTMGGNIGTYILVDRSHWCKYCVLDFNVEFLLSFRTIYIR